VFVEGLTNEVAGINGRSHLQQIARDCEGSMAHLTGLAAAGQVRPSAVMGWGRDMPIYRERGRGIC
jgi:hypothetical protein